MSKKTEQAMKHGNKLGEGAAKRRAMNLTPEEKMKVVMDEYHRGTLHSGSGEIVNDRQQAISIALSESGLSNKRKNKKHA